VPRVYNTPDIQILNTVSKKTIGVDSPASARWGTIGVMPMKVREVIRLIEKEGWVEMRSRGSHRHFKHPGQAFVITVPGNDGKELAPGTLNAILKKAGLK